MNGPLLELVLERFTLSFVYRWTNFSCNVRLPCEEKFPPHMLHLNFEYSFFKLLQIWSLCLPWTSLTWLPWTSLTCLSWTSLTCFSWTSSTRLSWTSSTCLSWTSSTCLSWTSLICLMSSREMEALKGHN